MASKVLVHLEARDELVAQGLDAILKLGRLLCLPIRTALARHGIASSEANIENILGVVAIVAGKALVGEAELAHGQRRLAGRSESIGVAPDAIKLDTKSSWLANWMAATDGNRHPTHQLVIAHDGHDAKWLHPIFLRAERRAGALVSKDDVRVDVGIEIGNTVHLDGVLEGRLPLATGVVCAAAGRVIGAVAVNVHVVIVAAAPLEEDGVGEISAIERAAAEGR